MLLTTSVSNNHVRYTRDIKNKHLKTGVVPL